MSALFRILWILVTDQRRAMLRGALLSAVVLMMGAALLGLSGWFISAAAAAGLAGLGNVFDVFRPSAMVRFLALGRAAARYGERLLTHHATLKALAGLRVRLLARLTEAPFEQQIRLRGGQAVNRLTADVDALDGVPLRLALPVLAGIAALALALVALWHLVDLQVAAWVVLILLLGAMLVLALGARAARAPSRRAELAAQAVRSRMIDLIAARADLAVYGQLDRQAQAVRAAEARRMDEAARLDRVERRAGAALTLTGTVAMAGALALGGWLAQHGMIDAPRAAIGVFVALALVETIAPLRRTLADLGRTLFAARRTLALMDDVAQQPESHPGLPASGRLELEAVSFRRGAGAGRTGVRAVLSGFDLALAPGEWLALTGPSGSGKSTVLLLAARMLAPETGGIRLDGRPLHDWSETALRAAVVLVPQRAALLQGTVAENLRLAAPEASDEALWQALETCALSARIAAGGGLAMRLGPRGASLSGGEARRLVLARALLRQPKLLLLDEPTEGLDAATASAVLAGLRRALPQTAVLIAAHRAEEQAAADRIQSLTTT